MTDTFNSTLARLGRLFGGDPIFIGHPDDPALANQFPDKKAYGWIKELETRADGLYLKPKWGDEGLKLLSNAHFKWFSPRWGCKRLPGIQADGKPVVEPVHFKSLGLTNNPNIQGILPLSNDATPTQGEPQPMNEALIKLLGLDPAATDEQILAAVTQLQTDQAAACAAVAEQTAAVANEKTALANEKTAKEAALQSAKTERKARIDLLLSNAIAAGKITAAQRPQWAGDLEKDLDAKIVELNNSKPILSTSSKTQDLGNRNSSAVAGRDAATRRDRVLTLVNERIQKTGQDYESAFANIKKENPALFAEMHTPGK